MRVLIVYTSRYGSTKEMVELLASQIHGTVEKVDLRRARAPKLEGYQVVIIGAPVFARKIPVLIKRFCQIRHTELSSRKVGLFLSCIARYDRALEYLDANFPAWLREQSFAREIFGGRLEMKKISFFHRFLLKQLSRIKYDRNAVNPAAIARFAEKINALSV